MTQTPETFLAYRVDYEYVAPSGGFILRRGDILFGAPDPVEALASFQRWWKCRLECAPEFFGRLLYMQLSPHRIGPIDAKGNMYNGAGFRLMEWSRDRAGVDFDTYCEWKTAEWNRRLTP